jgi:Clp amino terminal domain, pathogenicity island component
VQQSLTPEATATVKQAVTLARRRGHAQVTPLHVASTMLSSPTGLLRTACLKSHSHPLQCKALELCFNVALNRLPASTSPILSQHSHHVHGHHFNPPITLSNALIAAFKRAQANQRRGGSTEPQQQQPVLTIKIELEQLIISILDDPSVSRVMREAGFSSTQVKNHVEEACTKSSTPTSPNPNPRNYTNPSLSSPTEQTKSITLEQVKSEDVVSVLDCLSCANKRRVVIVGESLTSTEGVARSVIDRIKKGEVDESISNLHFINFQIYPFRHLTREEVDQKLGEIKSIARSYTFGKGVVLVLEDLKWVSEFWASYVEKGRNSYYCPIEHAIMEIRNLILGGINGGERVWFLGVGTYQNYIKCRSGVPSLETLWGLHAINIPTGGLGLSLNFDRY